jgi:hypothetical protein
MLGMFASVRAYGQAKTGSGVHGLKQNERKSINDGNRGD